MFSFTCEFNPWIEEAYDAQEGRPLVARLATSLLSFVVGIRRVDGRARLLQNLDPRALVPGL